MSNLSIIPVRVLYDTRIQADDITLLNVVCIHTDENGWCFPSLERISRIFSPLAGRDKPYDESSISKKLGRLEKLGYLVNPKQRHKDGGGFSSNQYKVIYDAELPLEFDRRKIQAPLENASVEIQAPLENPQGENQTNDPCLTPQVNDPERESGQKPPAPPEPPKAEKSAKAKVDLFPVVTSLSEVCQMPFEINRGRLFREAKQLCAAAVVPPVTPDEVRARYGAGGWWYREDWRGQKGEPPTPAAIRQTWGQWTVPKVIPFKRDTKAAKLADTFARWDAEAGNGNTTNHNGDPQEIFECVSFTVT